MPRPLKTDRPKRLEVQLPQSLRSQDEAELYSEVEGRVPHGAWSVLFEELLLKWLESRKKGTIHG